MTICLLTDVCQSAERAPWGVQDAHRGLHAAQQRVQELEDACSAAEEKAGCLEAMLQQYDAKLAEVCIH